MDPHPGLGGREPGVASGWFGDSEVFRSAAAGASGSGLQPRLVARGGDRTGCGCNRHRRAGPHSGPHRVGLARAVVRICGPVSARFRSYVVLFTLAAALEEFVFRGYPLQVLAEGSRRWIAGILLCLPFTLGHANNPDVTMIGVANIFLASVILVILYFQTRRLWLPISIHLSWNLAQSWLWGFDVSGIKIDNQLFVVTPTGADLVTGGEFGLEGSILSTILFVVVVVWFLVRPILRPADQVAALWARYPAGFGSSALPEPDAPNCPDAGL